MKPHSITASTGDTTRFAYHYGDNGSYSTSMSEYALLPALSVDYELEMKGYHFRLTFIVTRYELPTGEMDYIAHCIGINDDDQPVSGSDIYFAQKALEFGEANVWGMAFSDYEKLAHAKIS